MLSAKKALESALENLKRINVIKEGIARSFCENFVEGCIIRAAYEGQHGTSFLKSKIPANTDIDHVFAYLEQHGYEVSQLDDQVYVDWHSEKVGMND